MPVFGTVIAMDFTTALLAVFVLRPLRKRLLANEQKSEKIDHGVVGTTAG